ncbi:MAG: LysE family translocator [Pelagimonas sp.]|jgi:threonine/homoserine/homoserine lactone efflux protein|nr:LysE family translocator [Pelagimonas sp.]
MLLDLPIDLIVLLGFVPAALMLNLTPGADMMFCLAQGLKGGARAGWAASAGVAAGGLVHSLLAGLGLSALLAAAPWMFELIRWIGVAYLLYLAWKAFRAKAGEVAGKALSPKRAAWQGFAVNLSNPKVILFILAFVPQFVDPTRPILLQFMIFGVVMALGGLLVNGLVGQLAGRMGGWLSGRGGVWLHRATGAIFAGLALKLASGARG